MVATAVGAGAGAIVAIAPGAGAVVAVGAGVAMGAGVVTGSGRWRCHLLRLYREGSKLPVNAHFRRTCKQVRRINCENHGLR
jgi:hypothetical protein